MIALLGPPPKELLDRERKGRMWKWRPAIENSEGTLCDNASTYYGGPFFDSEGKLTQTVKQHTALYKKPSLTLNIRRVHV